MGYHFAISAALASAVVGGFATAQEVPARNQTALELTMVLIPSNATTPDSVTKTIELPKDEANGVFVPNARGVEQSAHGLETANAAREDGRAFGQATAAAARDNRESAARASGGERPERPTAPPETPERPIPPPR